MVDIARILRKHIGTRPPRRRRRGYRCASRGSSHGQSGDARAARSTRVRPVRTARRPNACWTGSPGSSRIRWGHGWRYRRARSRGDPLAVARSSRCDRRSPTRQAGLDRDGGRADGGRAGLNRHPVRPWPSARLARGEFQDIASRRRRCIATWETAECWRNAPIRLQFSLHRNRVATLHAVSPGARSTAISAERRNW